MRQALLVGPVSDLVVMVLTELGYRVRRVAATAEPDPDVDLAVVHEAPDGTPEYDGVSAWLELLRDEGTVTVFQAEWYDDDRIVRRLITPRITNILESDGVSAEHVRAVIGLAEGHPAGEVGGGDLVLGRHFESEPGRDSTDAYERRRGLSMVTPSMVELVNDINFAVQRMSGTSEGRPWPKPPWDPAERVESRLNTSRQPWTLNNSALPPRLSDLYALPSLEVARQLLGATEEAIALARHTHVQATMAIIRGESGSGKTFAARLMWRAFANATEWARDDPSKMPFVKVNCGGMTSTNFDHLMLGAGPGQFTDVRSRVGHFGRSDYGVLFLDEIGDMDSSAQSRFKPLLDDLIIEPPGLFAYPLHTRVIAATNVELEDAERGFQHDLLRRFNIQIRVPGINERTDTEKLLQVDFVAQLPTINPREAGELVVPVIDAAVVDALLAHDWSHGNFRELQEVVQGAVTAARKRRSKRVEFRDLAFVPKNNPGDERVVNLADASVGEGRPTLRVRSRGDLLQAARLLSQPVYRLPDGSEIVLTDNHQLILPADPAGKTSG